MKAFHCDECGSLVFFENVHCVCCNHALGFLPDVIDLSTLSPQGDITWRALSAAAKGRLYKQCANGRQHQVCNWLIPAEEANSLCVSCRLNEVIPDLSVPHNVELWHKMEMAKRRAIYTLLRMNLPTEGGMDAKQAPLRFRFLSELPGGPPVLTGHDEGVITINIAEANEAERERRRLALHEPFRTLLGHFRHEISHYYWDALVRGTPQLNSFRELFGDETRDYAAALQAHYQQGPPANWQERFISTYATAHAWEDWAETSAHYFHMVDTVETAASFGVALRPRHPNATAMTADPRAVSVSSGKASFDRILENWVPLTYALNELNRGMGLPDLYPFVLSLPVIEKLRFVHKVFERTK